LASTAVLLFLSACSTAVIHALIPDHWLPFVLLARLERWSSRRTMVMVGVTGLIHASVSILVGAGLTALGASPARGLARHLGASLELVGGILLVLFGVSYGLWAHVREARAHRHAPADGAGAAGPAVHGHGHLLSRLSRGYLSGGTLVAIIGVSPCVLLQPILFAAASEGLLPAILSAAGFTLCTIATMLAVTLFATRGIRGLHLSFFGRYGDLISGLVIAAIGTVMVFKEL